MSSADQFACLGISALGMCSYDPAHPANIYFSVGNATAALAFTFAIQQFIKPIYRFRLQAYGIKIWHLLLLVLAGFLCAVIAAVLPNIPVTQHSFLHYPIVWELIGTLLIGLAYTISAFIALVPARIYDFNFVSFIRAGAKLLAAADDADRASFAEDLLDNPHNLRRLISYPAAWQRAEAHEATIEFEHLRTIGAQLQIQGEPPVSAFYRFTHRVQLERATYASSFLRIISDSEFCSVLACKCSWLMASAINAIAKKNGALGESITFIQEVARQAITNDNSMMAKEISYRGFSAAPLLSETLFSDFLIRNRYDPLDSFRFSSEPITAQVLARFNNAAERCLAAIIESGHLYEAQTAFSIQLFYRTAFGKISEMQESSDRDYRLLIEFKRAVKLAIEAADALLAEIDPAQRGFLYVVDPKVYRHDVLESFVQIVYEALAATSNRFKGPDDSFWSMAIEIFMTAFPSHGPQPDGMTPFQQRLALEIIDKLHNNMAGFYPAISRVLLACVGPYEQKAAQRNPTAFNILKEAMYIELRSLPELAAKSPDKLAHYLPDNVTYDLANTELIHTYSFGGSAITNVTTLKLKEVSLLAIDIRN